MIPFTESRERYSADRYVTSLTYDLEMVGVFDTESGDDLTSSCAATYTQSLLEVTINQRTEVNALLGTTLCSGMAISLGIPTARLNSAGSVVRRRRLPLLHTYSHSTCSFRHML